MTRKDYEMIAEVVKNNTKQMERKTINSFVFEEVLPKTNIVNALCELFKQDNPRFNAGKFREACNG